MLESSPNHPPTHPWKNCLPQNWSPVPKRLGTATIGDRIISTSFAREARQRKNTMKARGHRAGENRMKFSMDVSQRRRLSRGQGARESHGRGWIHMVKKEK